jgi:hypothetical protein
MPKYLLFFMASALVVLACRRDSDADGTIKPVNDLNEAAALGQPFAAPPADTTTVLGVRDTVRQSGNRRLACRTTTQRLTKRLTDFVNLSEATDLYPGAILQGALLRNGQITSIGDFPREKVRLTLTGLDFGSENVSRDVVPNLANVTQAIREMTGSGARNLGLNSYTYRVSEAYSQQQALASLGIGSGAADLLGIGASADFGESSSWSHVFVYFRQTYFTVSIPTPAAPADLFTAQANPADLAARIRPDNPAAYVKQVSYGRILVARISLRQSQRQRALAAEVRGVLGGLLSGGATTSEMLREAEFELKVYGGKAENLPQDLEGIRQFIQGGLAFDANTNALPVAYVCNYLSDNSPFVRGDEATYSVTQCEDITQTRSFAVEFDYIGIVKHCDSGLQVNDLGVFEYSIQLFFNDQLIGQLGARDIERREGERIELRQRFLIENIVGQPGDCIRVVVSLREYDPLDADEVLAENVAIRHCHPWAYSDLYTDERSTDGDLGYRRNFVQNPETCEAYLFYRINELR